MSNTQPSFTRGEYWILESAVTTMYPIGILTDPDLELALNKKGHGLDRDGLIRTLGKLFAEEFIEAYQCDPFEWGKEKLLGRLTPAQITFALNDVDAQKISKDQQREPCRIGNPRYRLTAKGGAAWEAFAAPDWSRFIDSFDTTQSGETQPVWVGEATCADQKYLERYFHSLKRTKIGIDEASVIWNEVQPWQATYWKELPLGYRIRFQYKGDLSEQGWDKISAHDYFTVYQRDWYRWC